MMQNVGDRLNLFDWIAIVKRVVWGGARVHPMLWLMLLLLLLNSSTCVRPRRIPIQKCSGLSAAWKVMSARRWVIISCSVMRLLIINIPVVFWIDGCAGQFGANMAFIPSEVSIEVTVFIKSNTLWQHSKRPDLHPKPSCRLPTAYGFKAALAGSAWWFWNRFGEAYGIFWIKLNGFNPCVARILRRVWRGLLLIIDEFNMID